MVIAVIFYLICGCSWSWGRWLTMYGVMFGVGLWVLVARCWVDLGCVILFKNFLCLRVGVVLGCWCGLTG